VQCTLGRSVVVLRDNCLLKTCPGRAVLALAASVFVCLCAHLSVSLPFTPVPLTLSNFAVLLVGLAVGPATAFSAMVLYLAEGAAGMPVFSPHGLGGIAQLLGPTGGFLLTYPFAAALAGFVVRKAPARLPRFAAAALACTLATLIIFIFGAGWLALLKPMSATALFYVSVAPFLPGEIVKIISASGIFGALRSRTRS